MKTLSKTTCFRIAAVMVIGVFAVQTNAFALKYGDYSDDILPDYDWKKDAIGFGVTVVTPFVPVIGEALKLGQLGTIALGAGIGATPGLVSGDSTSAWIGGFSGGFSAYSGFNARMDAANQINMATELANPNNWQANVLFQNAAGLAEGGYLTQAAGQFQNAAVTAGGTATELGRYIGDLSNTFATGIVNLNNTVTISPQAMPALGQLKTLSTNAFISGGYVGEPAAAAFNNAHTFAEAGRLSDSAHQLSQVPDLANTVINSGNYVPTLITPSSVDYLNVLSNTLSPSMEQLTNNIAIAITTQQVGSTLAEIATLSWGWNPESAQFLGMVGGSTTAWTMGAVTPAGQEMMYGMYKELHPGWAKPFAPDAAKGLSASELKALQWKQIEVGAITGLGLGSIQAGINIGLDSALDGKVPDSARFRLASLGSEALGAMAWGGIVGGLGENAKKAELRQQGINEIAKFADKWLEEPTAYAPSMKTESMAPPSQVSKGMGREIDYETLQAYHALQDELLRSNFYVKGPADPKDVTASDVFKYMKDTQVYPTIGVLGKETRQPDKGLDFDLKKKAEVQLAKADDYFKAAKDYQGFWAGISSVVDDTQFRKSLIQQGMSIGISWVAEHNADKWFGVDHHDMSEKAKSKRQQYASILGSSGSIFLSNLRIWPDSFFTDKKVRDDTFAEIKLARAEDLQGKLDRYIIEKGAQSTNLTSKSQDTSQFDYTQGFLPREFFPDDQAWLAQAPSDIPPEFYEGYTGDHFIKPDISKIEDSSLREQIKVLQTQIAGLRKEAEELRKPYDRLRRPTHITSSEGLDAILEPAIYGGLTLAMTNLSKDKTGVNLIAYNLATKDLASFATSGLTVALNKQGWTELSQLHLDNRREFYNDLLSFGTRAFGAETSGRKEEALRGLSDVYGAAQRNSSLWDFAGLNSYAVWADRIRQQGGDWRLQMALNLPSSPFAAMAEQASGLARYHTIRNLEELAYTPIKHIAPYGLYRLDKELALMLAVENREALDIANEKIKQASSPPYVKDELYFEEGQAKVRKSIIFPGFKVEFAEFDGRPEPIIENTIVGQGIKYKGIEAFRRLNVNRPFELPTGFTPALEPKVTPPTSSYKAAETSYKAAETSGGVNFGPHGFGAGIGLPGGFGAGINGESILQGDKGLGVGAGISGSEQPDNILEEEPAKTDDWGRFHGGGGGEFRGGKGATDSW